MRRDYPALVRRHAAAADGIIVVSAAGGRPGQSNCCTWTPSASASARTACPAGRRPASDRAGKRDGPTTSCSSARSSRERTSTACWTRTRDLLARRPDAPPLRLAGGSVPGAEAWRDAIARPPLLGRVDYHGYVERRATARRSYAGARLLVLPSFDEGFGLPVVEAMSLGVPVVASNRGALPEVSGGAALLVDPEDIAGLSQAMERVLFDGPVARRMAEDGLRQAASFTLAARRPS